MGASFQEKTYPASLSEVKIRKAFQKLREQDQYENGHCYSGGFGMVTGLAFRGETFTSIDGAVEWLQEHTRKWEDALAVKAVDSREKLWNGLPNPDFNNEVWVVGAWCAS